MVSIIIVHYKANDAFFDCLRSLKENNPKSSFEIIVVDNDEKAAIDKEIKKKFSRVVYIKSRRNGGFGAGNNLGAKHAKGEYLFFLNPDTIIFKDTIDTLVDFLEKNKEAAVVAPLLLDPRKKPYALQGTAILTPLRAIFSLSFINKLIPHNPIARRYWNIGWDKTKLKEVDVVPGTALMVRKNVYDECNGFDENFFLYFEEYDLCKRIREKGYKIFITPNSKIIHLWGKGGTNEAKGNISNISKQSRFYYFKKHYGLLTAFLINTFLNFEKKSLVVVGILLISAFLLFYKITTLIPFIGDQGWFYLSARDVVLGKSFPLVGVAASHPWLHQGAYWTYMLAFMLWLFHFDPVSGAYLTALLGVVSVWLIYYVGKLYFSIRVGVIASFLYATSPLVITNSRMAYHTSPIPFFTLLFLLSLYQWIKGNKYFFPLCIFFLAVLYNFELATATLGIIFVFIVLFGIWKRKNWVRSLKDWRIIFYSVVAYIIPMTPMIFYDLHHGFPQTLKFVAWLGYHVLLVFGFPSIHPNLIPMSWSSVVSFAAQNYQMLIFTENAIIAFIIFLVSLGLFYTQFYRMMRRKKYHLGMVIIGVLTILLICGFFANRTTSSAYLPDISPFIILLTAVAAEIVMKKFFASTFLFLLIIGILNTHSLLIHNYFVGISYKDRLLAANEIVKETDHKQYNLIGEGPGSQFASFTMNYQYLTWLLGTPASSSPQPLKFIISETNQAIYFKQERQNK